jgi:predicted GIY-YIG superfamily endonuclease
MAADEIMAADSSSSEWLAFADRVREEAHVVAEVGYWAAPPGYLIYWAVNIRNWKFYIGATKNFGRRVGAHLNAAGKPGGPPLCHALRKHGGGAFAFVPIEYFDSEAEMFRAEIQMIADCRSRHRDIGYNVANGGEGIGSDGAKAVHARPGYREYFLASGSARAVKAAATRRLNRA